MTVTGTPFGRLSRWLRGRSGFGVKVDLFISHILATGPFFTITRYARGVGCVNRDVFAIMDTFFVTL